MYFRRPCKPSCDFNETQLSSPTYCNGNPAGPACCVPRTNSPPPTTPPPTPPLPNGGWENWSNWGTCTGSCDFAYQYRFRRCLTSTQCLGVPVEVRPCLPSVCVSTTTATTITLPPLSNWTEWSACSTSCGDGVIFRSRQCNRPEGCGNERLEETKTCNYGACPAWNPWSMWSECSKSCGGGTRSRRRECIDPTTSQPVTPDKCEGHESETGICNTFVCPDSECGKGAPFSRVIGGGNALSCLWPWMVHIKIPVSPPNTGKTTTACSGVLVDKNSVVTTASCAKLLTALNDFNVNATITVADFDSSTTDGVDVYFTKVIPHPKYVEGQTTAEADQLKTDNLAIIQLDTNIERGVCRNYVCLPDYYRDAAHNACIFAGWGLTANGQYAGSLQIAAANLQHMTSCKSFYQWSESYNETTFEGNFLCGSTPSSPTVACEGDEGGMLVCPDMSTSGVQWTLTGLSKPADCKKSQPNLFVSVTSKIDWIRETMALND